jgi:hypothetical protein
MIAVTEEEVEANMREYNYMQGKQAETRDFIYFQ